MARITIDDIINNPTPQSNMQACDANFIELYAPGNNVLHYHDTDRDRANHTGTQTASTISDFDTEVSNNTDVVANTAKITNATHIGDVTGATTLSISSDAVKDTHIDFGTGVGQVSASDLPIIDFGGIITATEVEGALQENRVAIDLNTTHRTSDGKDHSDVVLNNTHRSSDGSDHIFIDQDVTIGSAPTFDGVNFTGIGGRSIRQTMLSGPDLTDTPGTIETSATASGDLRNIYHSLSCNMLDGSRGGMCLEIYKSSGVSNFLQSSILDETTNYLLTNTTGIVGDNLELVKQFTSRGVQLGSAGALASANLAVFHTTHKTILDGNEWHYNPTSGFAMCMYTGTGAQRQLKHPMQKEPLWWAVKATNIAYNWVTGRKGTKDYMILNETNTEGDGSPVWGAVATDTYIPMENHSWINGGAGEYFLWGWFGEPLDDLEVGMSGERGVTSFYTVNEANLEIDTGITDIQTIIYKRLDIVGGWLITSKPTNFGLYTWLDNTDAELTGGGISVNGSKVAIAQGNKLLVIVIGSTADRPTNRKPTNTKALRKVGTGATGHRVDLGHDFISGNNGGMVFGRDVITANSHQIYDTIRGATNALYTDLSSAESIVGGVTVFGNTGITCGSSPGFNGTNINQYSVFPTTHKATTSDGLNWSYNPLTGFAMCKYTGDGVAGRTLKHPVGKKPRMMWIKSLDNIADWQVGIEGIPYTQALYLNEASIPTTSVNFWNDTNPTTTEISLGIGVRANANGINYIIYAWFGDDTIPGADPSVTGIPGASAVWQYTGGSGAMSIDTGIDDIETILLKPSSASGSWLWYNIKSGIYYTLDGTAIEVADTSLTVEGSTVSWAGDTATTEFVCFGSSVSKGFDNDVILPSSVSNPTIVSAANGFDAGGNVDIVKEITTTQTLPITGAAGTKFIGLDVADNSLFFDDARPEYLRNYVPYVKGNYVYDIDKALMYNASGYGPPIEQDWVEDATNPGGVAVGNSVTFTPNNSGDQVMLQANQLVLNNTYRVKGRVISFSGSGILYLPHSNGSTATAEKMYAIGTFDYTFEATNTTGRIQGGGASQEIIVIVDSIQEVVVDEVKPSVFIGECDVEVDGSVSRVQTYQKGDVAVGDFFTRLPSTVTYEDNPFGHKEVLTHLIGKTLDVEKISTEIIEITDDAIKITTDASPDAIEYKSHVRRNF